MMLSNATVLFLLSFMEAVTMVATIQFLRRGESNINTP